MTERASNTVSAGKTAGGRQAGAIAFDDAALVEQCRRGDMQAFAALVAKYQDRIFNTVFRMCQSRADAEELAQETFLRALERLSQFRGESKFYTWLFRIANNLAKNSRRRKGRHREVPFNARDSGPIRPEEKFVADKSALMPTRQLDQSEREQMVQSALSGLNERQKMAVLLHKFEQMSYADIGTAMNLTPTAVKSLLSRARESLRTKLEPYMK